MELKPDKLKRFISVIALICLIIMTIPAVYADDSTGTDVTETNDQTITDTGDDKSGSDSENPNTEESDTEDKDEEEIITNVKAPENFIFIGDSRTVEMSKAVTATDNDIWVAKRNEGFDWFSGTAVEQAEASTEIDDDDAVIILMGVNDKSSNTNDISGKYADIINEKAEQWTAKGADVYFVSVNPVDEAKEAAYTKYSYSYNNNWIQTFNEYMKNKLSDDVRYIDVYSRIAGHLSVRSDGIHYNNSTYKEIYGIIKNDISIYNSTTKDNENDVNASVHDTLLCSSAPYTDVNKNCSQWSHNAIDYVIGKDLMVGNKNLFSPSGSVSRAMIVQVLYAMEGSPEVTESTEFTDLKKNWYVKAITWAESNGIASGYNDKTFKPDASVTREQIATFFKAYCEYKKYSTDYNECTDKYTDKEKISKYATESVEWAVYVGLISGRTTTTIVPKGTATREELAVILYKFQTSIVPVISAS